MTKNAISTTEIRLFTHAHKRMSFHKCKYVCSLKVILKNVSALFQPPGCHRSGTQKNCPRLAGLHLQLVCISYHYTCLCCYRLSSARADSNASNH